MDIGQLRQEYMHDGLTIEQLDSDPIKQFSLWFQQALDAGITEPNAVSLATVDCHMRPSLRTVLIKQFDAEGFVFYTNYGSNKAQDLRHNNTAALLFPWIAISRQVSIQGPCEKLSIKESLNYFRSRPRGSQLGAWTSEQSSEISSRQVLEETFARMKQKFSDGDIPLPDFWGGYRLVPEKIEFWQGRQNRLHDRFLYLHKEHSFEKDQPSLNWQIARLAP